MIDGLPIVAMGPGALLSLVVLLVLTDRLVWYKRLQVLEKRNAVLEQTTKDALAQNKALLDELIPPVRAVFTALHEASGGDDG